MTTRKTTKSVALPEQPEEPVAADDPHVTPKPATTVTSGEVSEYTLDDGSTYLLTAEEAEARGAKAKAKTPENKSVTPSNK
jgi:hypothetical protein